MTLQEERQPGILGRTSKSLFAPGASPISLWSSHQEYSPTVEGKFLRVQGRRFLIKGVTYGSFRPNDQSEPFPPFAQLKDDFARMRDAGINTVRLYSPPSDRIADAAADAGLFLIPDICWGPRRCELDDPERMRFIFNWTKQHSHRLAGHPAMLLYSIGNEIPPLLVRWYGRARIESFLRSLCDTVKEQAPYALVTYADHPPTEHLHLPFLDVVSYNVYLEREPEFRAYLARLQMLAGGRPVMLSEIGLDGARNGEQEQAKSLDWQLRAVFEKGLVGATVYGWTDDWAIFNEEIEEWAFGLTDAQRRPKPALDAVRNIYTSSRYHLREKPWPKVTVVVASYNGAATLERCLSSLNDLRYPDYEVIVVDDGSTDSTSRILQRHPVHAIRVPNGGLSRARNLGIQAATGEIVAFIDSDAYADPDWLYHMVVMLEEQNGGAVGGPNLSPPEDGFIAQCVEHAPGNPTHVLLDNERAEHVPGCNMAFRKAVLEEIGFFDPTHRAAGDDVDVCWKLLVRGRVIAFSPAAVVWHHRRPSIRAFLKQQRGYGYAESHLHQRYPGRYNFFGHSVWKGNVYDSPHNALRLDGLSSLFHPRIYQGQYGSAQFQSLYQPFQIWWFQIFTTIEWQVTSWCILLAGLLAGHLARSAALPLYTAAFLMFLPTLMAAGLAALRGIRAQKWKGWSRCKGFVVIAFLHIAQPLARAAGRIHGWQATRDRSRRFPPFNACGEISHRENSGLPAWNSISIIAAGSAPVVPNGRMATSTFWGLARLRCVFVRFMKRTLNADTISFAIALRPASSLSLRWFLLGLSACCLSVS